MPLAKYTLILCIVCGMLLVGETILPAAAPGPHPLPSTTLFFQSDKISGVSDSYYMDTQRPSGSVVTTGAPVLHSRPLAMAQTFQHFAVRLWLTPSDRVRRISVYVGWSDQIYKRSTEWCSPCGSSGDIPGTVTVIRFIFDVDPMTIKLGDRLYINITYPILWGDSEHASCVETDHAEFMGIPIPEFPSAILVFMSVLAVLSVTKLSAESLVRKKHLA